MKQLIPAIASLLCWAIVLVCSCGILNSIANGNWVSLLLSAVGMFGFMHWGTEHYRRAVSR
ncbi:hypothetical protein [Rhodococcus sp. NPDC127528]|uniref:hypothetical protein n=1 Tax=unclassified Rhodococcus (in: high G+C Gram-positive bacteria) TaxID=192944 RepID=UPI0036439B23